LSIELKSYYSNSAYNKALERSNST